MPAPSVLEIATAVASIVSALGGCAAAYAAFLSARSAREATQAAEATIKQAALREASRMATTIVLEGTALKSVCNATQGSIKSSVAFSGVSSSSGHEQLIRNMQDTARRVDPMIADAELFIGGAKSLSKSPVVEIERVGHRLWENLESLRTLHRQVEDVRSSIEGQNEQHRSRIIGRMHIE